MLHVSMPRGLEFHRVTSQIPKSFLKVLSKSVKFAGGGAMKRNDSRAQCRGPCVLPGVPAPAPLAVPLLCSIRKLLHKPLGLLLSH